MREGSKEGRALMCIDETSVCVCAELLTSDLPPGLLMCAVAL